MDDVAIIGKHEQALRTAMLSNDVEVLTGLLDDDLVFTGPDGHVLTKEDDLTVHRNGLLRLDQLDLYESQIHRVGAMILVTTKATIAGRFGTTSFHGLFAYTRLWRQSGVHWRIVAGHAAKIG
jgi:hypothetical protein